MSRLFKLRRYTDEDERVEVYINADSVEYFYPWDRGGTFISFCGSGLVVEESFDDIYKMLEGAISNDICRL